VAADDQVVVDRQVEALAGLHQGPGQFLVGGGGLQVAARVVVDQYEPGGLVFQGQLHHDYIRIYWAIGFLIGPYLLRKLT
jgi:hypothetical protein